MESCSARSTEGEEYYDGSKEDRPVRILAQVSEGEVRDHVAQILASARGYDDSVYIPWPGPNSNTFAEKIIRETEGVAVVVDHNAIGKDWGWRIGRTGGGRGWRSTPRSWAPRSACAKGRR